MAYNFGNIHRLRDDPVREIASFGDKPLEFLNINRYARDRYGCAPTPTRYRVLSQTRTVCPKEARLNEPNSLCCTSTDVLSAQSNAESLWFLRALKRIHMGIPPGLPVQIPRNLRRVIRWIHITENGSDIGIVNPNTALRVRTDDERFLDIMKFSMMSQSTTRVVGVLSGTQTGVVQSQRLLGVHGQSIHVDIDEGIPVLHDVVRIVNEVGVGELTLNPGAAGGVINVPPPIRTRVIAISNSPQGRRGVDLADISNIYNSNRFPELFTVDPFLVVRSSTTIHDEMLSLLNAMKTMVVLEFRGNLHVNQNVNQIVPDGYTGATFLANKFIHDLGLAFQNSVVEQTRFFARNLVPGQSDQVGFEYLTFFGWWVTFELIWNIPTATFEVTFI